MMAVCAAQACMYSVTPPHAAASLHLPVFTVRAPELVSKVVGESERTLRRVFNRAREAAPCVLLIGNQCTLFSR